MGRKGKGMSPDLKKVGVDLFKNGENIADIARILQQPRSTISDIIKRFREAGTVENRPRSGRPRAMDDTGYQQLEKIVKAERRAPLVKITANFNEERNVSVSKRTVRRRLMDHGFSRSVCRKKVVVKFDYRKKNDWHGVGRKRGGQLSTNGVKLYLVTSHKFVLGRSSVYMHGGNVEKGGDRNW